MLLTDPPSVTTKNISRLCKCSLEGRGGQNLFWLRIIALIVLPTHLMSLSLSEGAESYLESTLSTQPEEERIEQRETLEPPVWQAPLRTHSEAFRPSSFQVLQPLMMNSASSTRFQSENQPALPGHGKTAPEQAKEKAPSWSGFAVGGRELNISSS